MKNLSFFLALFALLSMTSCGPAPEQVVHANTNLEINSSEISSDRGAYLVTLMDCNICHTPKKMTDRGPVPDMDRMLSGYPGESFLPKINRSELAPGKWLLFHQELTAAVGPWGVSFAANLTPDETGLGNWTFEHFKKSMTEGKHKGLENGRMINPPMPWRAYSALKENDLKSIFEYLKSIPPVENIVPAHIPPAKL